MFQGGKPVNLSADPLEVLARWPADRAVVMLHSGRPHARWSRYTILAEPTGAYRFTDDASSWTGDTPPAIGWSHRLFRDLRSVLDSDTQALWAGYFSYDIVRWIEKLPSRADADRGWPIVQLERCRGWLVHDNTTGDWTAHGTYAGQTPRFDDIPADQGFTCGDIEPCVCREAFEQAIRKAIDYIAAGDIFQVNLAQRFTAMFEGDARALYRALASISPAWYGAYIESPGPRDAPRRTICSTSPELFLDVGSDGHVITRPIKGTRPASVHAEALRDSAKDIAELTMIVDLLRNDLGRVCDCGSVQVNQARTIESHPTVHHGVATICGRLHKSRDVIDLLRATLPGGSITGAPKVRAMQIIEELERVRRGPYCGAIGYIQGGSRRPTACFNIAIRTLLLEQDERGVGRVDFSVGGGIVADSHPAAEYQETLDKAAAMMRALGQ